MKRIHLYTTFYNDSDTSRNNEYLRAIENNIQNSLIDTITFLVEPNVDFPFISDKIKIIQVARRPTFNDFFENFHSNNPNSIHIIANTDIYFNETLQLIKPINLKSKVFALNRWDILSDDSCSFFNKYYTTDTWIFNEPPVKINVDFYMGQPGCDNRLNYELMKAGFDVMNPSYSIITCHLHQTQIRSYIQEGKSTNVVTKPYLYLLPDFLHERQTKAFRKKRILYRQIRYELYKEILFGRIDDDTHLLISKNKLVALINCIRFFNYKRVRVHEMTFHTNEV